MGTELADVDLNYCDLSIQESELPSGFSNRRMAQYIGNVGTFVDFDEKPKRGNFNGDLLIHILLDVTKPLIRVLKLEGPNKQKMQAVSITYERLHNSCYYCGVLRH